MRRQTLALIQVVAAGACWGLSAVIAKIGFDRGVGPTRMAEARVVVAFVILFGLLAWRRPDLLRPPPGSLPLLVGFGVSVAGVNGSYYIAIDRVPVGVALSLQYTAPVLLLGLAALTGRRGPGRIAWMAAAATLAGSALVSRAFDGFRGINAPGLVAGLASAAFFALYLLAADEAGRRGVHPATLLLWGFVFATVTWSIAAPWWVWPWGHLGQPQVVWAVLGVGVVGTLIPFFLAVGAVPVLSPATAGIAATVEPPFAAAFAWLVPAAAAVGGPDRRRCLGAPGRDGGPAVQRPARRRADPGNGSVGLPDALLRSTDAAPPVRRQPHTHSARR